ncbi:MAG: translocation/assembly module TamB domain-containing protein, partial [Alphaproteobacteria bacterium]|nr:translocation/assembly module TamB domain-containing protein [Alphaproteobacteria bacterium]
SYSAEIAGALSTEGDLNFDGRVAADVADLRAFSGLAGRPISGAVEASVVGKVALLSGQFDLTVQSATRDVTVGIREVDALLEGNGQLTVLTARNVDGLNVGALRVSTPAALISGNGVLRSEGSRGEIEARLQDAAILLEGLEGPVSLKAAASQDGPVWTVDVASTGDALGLDVDGTIDTGPDVPIFRGDIAAKIADLAPFSRFAGRKLGGTVDADISGRVSFDATQVDAEIALAGQDLAVGIPQADRVLAGALEASAAVRRDGDTVDVSALRFETPAARITGEGAWRDGASRADIAAVLRDASLALEGLKGELRLTATAQQTGDIWDVVAQSAGDAIGLDLDGQIDTGGETPVFEGDVTAELVELAPFSQLAGRALRGRLAADASGVLAFDLSRLDLVLAARGANLSIGQLEADKILAGASEVTATVARDGDAITVREARFQSPALTASGTATLGQAENRVALEARLSDLAAFVPDVAGPASVTGTAVQTGGADWQIDLDIDGPGGTTVAAAGSVAPAFDNADLTLRGRAPLQLANPFIAPRQASGSLSFDLALNGAPGLPALSGQLQTSGARVVAPELGIVLNDLRATVGLGGARANLDVSAAVQSGGRITVTGPVGLTAPNASDLRIDLRRVVLTDPTLYESSVDGTLTIAGPLAGGGRIGGRLALGPSELRIPSATVGGTGAIPVIRHVNEPPEVRRTRARAGLIDDGKSSGGPGGGGPVFPLDLVITAENQIFIRGRGLDAEMAGRLRLGGTTANILPIGQFNLVRGRLDILGKRLVLNDGLVQLQGNFDPFIRLEATTQTQDVTVRIVVEGLASDPQIRFLSEPQLPEEEVVAQLLFGRGIETLSPLQAAQLASAVATLAGKGGAGVLSKVRESTGLDDLDVTTGDDGATAVRAGKYISEKVYTDVTVASDGESEVNLNFDLSPRVTLKGSVDTTGNTGVGVFFQRDY